ncbi:MAG: DUF4445 domain-containing protein [Treponema sp.]|nr:DUF4445 domain-containing protein [Treponema sp.]
MEILTDGTLPFIPEQLPATADAGEIGIAVDVGTTTIALNVWSIADRKRIAVVAEENAQLKYGHDVIKRISFAIRKPHPAEKNPVAGESQLHYCIIAQLEKLFQKAVNEAKNALPRGFQPKIKTIVITGNTTMLCFVCAVPVKSLAQAPFNMECPFDMTTTWKDVREGTAAEKRAELEKPSQELLNVFTSSVVPDDTSVYFPPCVSAFIGADTVCAMVAASFPIPGSASNLQNESEEKAPVMLVDIGTNSEIALYIADTAEKKGRILCTATAAGPAFEAANISCGMSAIDGAIDSIALDKDGMIVPHTIGGKNATGICGSGLVSSVATLFEHKYIEKDGAIVKSKSTLGDGTACIEMTPAVYLSQQDIRNLQLAKSAVKTGLAYLLEKSPELPILYIAGGFGTKLNIEDACKISMIPEELSERTFPIGNAALAGASALIFSPTLRLRARELKKKAVPINLAAVPEFQNRFLQSIDF